MRFKKLRLFVGIALILFIFITGNIIAFGKLAENNSDNQDKNSILVDPKQTTIQDPQTQTEPKKPVEKVQKIPLPEPVVVEPTPIPPAPVIVHHTTRTRAS